MRQIRVAALMMAVTGNLLISCGSGDEPEGDTGNGGAPAGETSNPTAPAGPLTPEQWADSMLACYRQAVRNTLAALEGTPPADQALPRMREVCEASIQQHLPLGRQREAMTEADRTKAGSFFLMKLMSVQSADDFKVFLELANGPYSPNTARTDEEKELARLIRSINIISQYGQFELLKKQEPEEAARLGIE
jgi:hypothetical protein